MNILESILNFLTTLVQIIFPRKQKSVAGDCSCPDPFPAPLPDGGYRPLASPEGNGDNPDSDRSDTLALHQSDRETKQHVEPINIVGYVTVRIICP
nr:hypothetical protein [Parabacteroides goldsteinii]